jgi:hypothetical protein
LYGTSGRLDHWGLVKCLIEAKTWQEKVGCVLQAAGAMGVERACKYLCCLNWINSFSNMPPKPDTQDECIFEDECVCTCRAVLSVTDASKLKAKLMKCNLAFRLCMDRNALNDPNAEPVSCEEVSPVPPPVIATHGTWIEWANAHK